MTCLCYDDREYTEDSLQEAIIQVTTVIKRLG